MPAPPWLARFNRVATNRATRLVADRLPGFGIVRHQGRRSGTRYRTPVNLFRRPGGFVVALTYGTGADWIRNVLAAGQAEVVTRGRAHTVVNPRIVHDPERTPVPAPVRAILGVLHVDDFLVVDEEEDR